MENYFMISGRLRKSEKRNSVHILCVCVCVCVYSTAGDITCCLYGPLLSSLRHAVVSNNSITTLCLILSDHLAAQQGWFNLCSAGDLWLVNPWRAFAQQGHERSGWNSNDVTTNQDISFTPQTPHSTHVYRHTNTHKAFCVHVMNHPDREHEILMNKITLYTHTQTIKWSFLEGLRWCVERRNVNNLQGGNTSLYINTLLSP